MFGRYQYKIKICRHGNPEVLCEQKPGYLEKTYRQQVQNNFNTEIVYTIPNRCATSFIQYEGAI